MAATTTDTIVECLKCINITIKCNIKTLCNDCVTCSKCINIRQNCKVKTTCNKCKEAAKIVKREAEHTANISELKELVKTDGKALLRAGDWWSKDAILTALITDCSISEEVAKLYPKKRCFTVHSDVVRSYIFAEIEKARQEQQRKQQAEIEKRNMFIQELFEKANRYAYEDHSYQGIYTSNYSRIIENNDMQQEHWLEAVKRHPGILEFVPMRYRTYELCYAAMQYDIEDAVVSDNNFPLRHVPNEYRSEEICLAAAAWCNIAIYHWPIRHRNWSMYIRAIQLNIDVRDVIPSSFRYDNEIRAAARWPLYYKEYECVHMMGISLNTYIPTENDIKASLDCSICLESFIINESDVCKTQCNHMYHKDCINKWLIKNRSCPKCRKYI